MKFSASLATLISILALFIVCSHDPTNPPNGNEGKPVISVEPIVVEIEVPKGAIGARRITISNKGEDTLNITSVEHGIQWMTVFPTEMQIPAGESQEMSLEANTASLTNSFYSKSITIKSNDPNNPSVTVKVNITVGGTVVGAEIDVDKALIKAYVVEGQIGTTKFSIYSQGRANLEVSEIRSKWDWLSFVPSSMSIPAGQRHEVTAVFDAQDLIPSSAPYPDTAVIISNDYDESQFRIPVQLFVVASNLKPDIEVSPMTQTIDVEPNAVYNFDLIIKNTGYIDLNVSDIVSNPAQSWLSVSPTRLTVKPNEQGKAKVTINTAGMQQGAEGSLAIYSNDPDENPVIISIKLKMGNTNRDALIINPSSLTMMTRESKSNTSYLKFINNSTKTIELNSIYGMVGWLNTDPAFLTLAAQSEAIIKVIADAYSLHSGRYSSFIHVDVADTSVGDKDIDVALTVVPGKGGDLSPPEKVTDFIGDEIMPSFSGDGLFLCYIHELDFEIKLEKCRYDGTQRDTILTTNTYKEIANPDWAPIEDIIVFDAINLGTRDIITTDLKGNTTIIISGGSNDFYPRWNYDGSRIVFVSDRSGNYDIWSCDKTGSDIVQITDNADIDKDPCWGINGNTIVFASTRSGNYDVWETVLDSKASSPLVQHPNLDRYPIISLHGWLVYASFRTGNWDLWFYDMVSQQTQNLTASYTSDEIYATFDLLGGKLVYSANFATSYDLFLIDGF